MFALSNRKALVTGASGGIGSAIARGLYQQGATLGLVGRNKAELDALARELGETIWPLLDEQKIRVNIDTIFPLEKFRDAHIRMESGNHFGKIILSLD